MKLRKRAEFDDKNRGLFAIRGQIAENRGMYPNLLGVFPAAAYPSISNAISFLSAFRYTLARYNRLRLFLGTTHSPLDVKLVCANMCGRPRPASSESRLIVQCIHKTINLVYTELQFTIRRRQPRSSWQEAGLLDDPCSLAVEDAQERHVDEQITLRLRRKAA